MFKKRSRPASVRQKESVTDQPEASGSGTSTPGVVDDAIGTPDGPASEDGEEGLTVDELIQLRKLRRSKQGIELAKLNRGEHKVKDNLGASEKYGLQTQASKAGQENEWMNEAERVKNRVRSNAFTQQTNALDVDKHMMAYIEEELQKRRGKATDNVDDNKSSDPEAELYKLAEKYRVEARKFDDEEEGNVTNSMGMLTSIPEIDLGMDNRLKNIEATERAKREMMELRKGSLQGRRKAEDAGYASARYHLPNLRVASDVYAMDEEKRQAAGLPPPIRPRGDASMHEQATDEQVYERFKKRGDLMEVKLANQRPLHSTIPRNPDRGKSAVFAIQNNLHRGFSRLLPAGIILYREKGEPVNTAVLRAAVSSEDLDCLAQSIELLIRMRKSRVAYVYIGW